MALGLALVLGVALLVTDNLGRRVVAPLFDRERLQPQRATLGRAAR